MKIIIKRFFRPPVTSSVFDQNIFLIAPFSNTFNLSSSVNLEVQISHPYAVSGVTIDLSSKGHPNIVLFADRK